MIDRQDRDHFSYPRQVSQPGPYDLAHVSTCKQSATVLGSMDHFMESKVDVCASPAVRTTLINPRQRYALDLTSFVRSPYPPGGTVEIISHHRHEVVRVSSYFGLYCLERTTFSQFNVAHR